MPPSRNRKSARKRHRTPPSLQVNSRQVDERPLAVLRRDISDPLFDLGLDLGVLLNPRHDFLTAALRQFAALHLSEHQLADELLLRELCSSLFARFEVLADAEAMELSLDPP